MHKHYKLVGFQVRRERGLDAVFHVQIKESVGEVKLSLQQDRRKHNYLKALTELRDSPLGPVFGSYIGTIRPIHYQLFDNCDEILSRIGDNAEGEEKRIQEACINMLRQLN